MKTYDISIPYTAKYRIEANTEEEALAKAHKKGAGDILDCSDEWTATPVAPTIEAVPPATDAHLAAYTLVNLDHLTDDGKKELIRLLRAHIATLTHTP